MTSQAEIAGWASVALLALITITYDFRSRRVPNWLVAVGLLLSVALVACGPIWALAYDWRDAVLGGAIAFACFLPLYVVGWMGAGDVKFFAVTGLLAGWHGLIPVWLIGSLLAGIHALMILLLRRMDASAPAAWMVMRVVPGLARLQTAEVGRRGIPYAAYMAIGLLCLQWVPLEMRIPWLPGM